MDTDVTVVDSDREDCLQSRLVRSRVDDWSHPLTAILGVMLMEFGDFAMMRRMLRGIKTRAESTSDDH